MNLNAAFPFENAGWPALIVNPDGVILRTNAAAAEAFGAYEGRNVNKFWSSQGGSFEALAKRTEAEKSEVSRKDGKKAVYVVCVAVVLGTEDSNYLLQFLPVKEAPLTTTPAEQVPAKTKIQSSVDIAQKQKLDCAMQLARTVSLDFNNALTSIIGYTSLLLSQSESGHPWRSSLVEIEKAAERAAEIANDLASFSRQEELSGRKAGNLNQVLRQTVAAFRVAAEQQGIALHVELEKQLFTAKFDEAKIQQAFAKLLENAMQAISGAGEITVRSRNCELETAVSDKTMRLSPGTYVCIEIVDTGSGVASQDLPRIFEPFFTTKGSAHRGLGLAWVYGIVTNHGGGVSFSSVESKGTTVTVYLPAIKRVIRENARSPEELFGAETVLIVDDEDLLLKMAQMVLSSFGYRVLTANTGAKALDILSQEPVDLVVTDLVMPQMGGRELIERIRLISPEAKIISSSGYVRPQNLAEDTYLQKPFTTQELLSKVRQVLSTDSTS